MRGPRGNASRKIPLTGRLLDAVAALVFVAGAVVAIRAHLGMRALEANPPGSEAGAFAGLAQFNHFWRLSRLGMILMLGGAGIAILAALFARFMRRWKTG